MDTCLPHHLLHRFGPYIGMSDPEAVTRAQRGDQQAAEYILYKYRGLVKTSVQTFFLPGAEREDLLQIGMIGLWQAIIEFRSDRSKSFRAFARICVRRHLLTAIKSAGRHKQLPLNASLPMEAALVTGQQDVVAAASLPQTFQDPEKSVLWQDYVVSLQNDLRRLLSDFEWRVLADFRRGMSYHEIASRLGCKVKSVDNALARIRRKASACRDALSLTGDTATRISQP